MIVGKLWLLWPTVFPLLSRGGKEATAVPARRL
jgi:hypothetical protein